MSLKPRFTEDGEVIAINLKKSVTIEGRDFFGRKAWITFENTNGLGSGSWYHDTGYLRCEKFWDILPEQVVSKTRRLCLVDTNNKVWMNHPEHITILRLLGLDDVAVSCGPGNWPPYLLAGELWTMLSPHLEYADYSLMWNPVVSKGIGTTQKKKRGETIISSHPNSSAGISVYSEIDYGRDLYSVSNFQYDAGYSWEELRKILFSPTQGCQSKALYWAACLVGSMNWPHHHKRICWPQEQPAEFTADFFNHHRILDILGFLGAVSLVGNKLISCQIISDKGGHLSDVLAYRKLM